ncbi:TetR/AcrR family transcriptional regulator [Winslowiella iniecta]|uniref:HTH tetR-type domain-containing protein n=1 Tax=Winslowiella iniecta TaxID=1560201 RepID=A0A0L7SYF9_9GAMM|nr:TetR/AcrR family transcriptional regulator [Winslowiella iniecta]KOC88167.1 hypothetical protein NG42_17405 [Winslowiella iniecta]KOC94191.1 hypothetical protein NG43_05815 [Winslowiella iniecta]
MVRKAENARERFGKAAMELFHQSGYSGTTVSQIAAAAGLTERTFFRYFADKPEVLFWRASEIQCEITQSIACAGDVKPLEMVMSALEKAGIFFDENRLCLIARHEIIDSHIEFQERELMKMLEFSDAIATALTQRGLAPSDANMVAAIGITFWRLALKKWLNDPSQCRFSYHLRECEQELNTIMSGKA